MRTKDKSRLPRSAAVFVKVVTADIQRGTHPAMIGGIVPIPPGLDTYTTEAIIWRALVIRLHYAYLDAHSELVSMMPQYRRGVIERDALEGALLAATAKTVALRKEIMAHGLAIDRELDKLGEAERAAALASFDCTRRLLLRQGGADDWLRARLEEIRSWPRRMPTAEPTPARVVERAR